MEASDAVNARGKLDAEGCRTKIERAKAWYIFSSWFCKARLIIIIRFERFLLPRRPVLFPHNDVKLDQSAAGFFGEFGSTSSTNHNES